MNSRYIGALILAPLMILLLYGGVFLKIGVFALSIMGMYEFYNVVRKKDMHPMDVVGYVLCITYYVNINLNKEIDYRVAFFAIMTSITIMLCIPIINTKYNFIDVAVTIMGFLYVTVFFSFIQLVEAKEYGRLLIWLIFLSSWLCDTTAYYVGKAFGRTKLCPEVSPKKTIEGSIGGFLGSTIACGVFGFIISRWNVNIPIIHFFLIGGASGVLSQFGDLVASSIKRYAGVKDYSNLIPGHGGILDRFDSILFSALVVYYYTTFIIGI